MMYVNWAPFIYYSITVADILLAAFVIYYIINFFIPKNILPFSLSVGFFLAIVFTVQYLKMQLSLWLIQKLLLILPFAILILFQQEIKQFTIHNLGQYMRRLFSDPKTQQTKESTLEIIEAFKYLSSRKIGAILVLEKEYSLETIKSRAVFLNATISSKLLISIFITSSPLHDGAVIVENNKLVVASSFLPLTDKSSAINLGSRHRAAIGITETTDAISFIVSEQNGHMSYAIAGELFYNKDIEEIQSILEGSLGEIYENTLH